MVLSIWNVYYKIAVFSILAQYVAVELWKAEANYMWVILILKFIFII